MKKLFKQLKRREKAAYPSFMLGLQHLRTWSDLQEYCESDQVQVTLLGENGYIILTPNEVLDMVASPSDIWRAIATLKTYYGSRPFTADFRETTSWKFVCMAKRRGKISVSYLHQWSWDSEIMHKAEIAFNL